MVFLCFAAHPAPPYLHSTRAALGSYRVLILFDEGRARRQKFAAAVGAGKWAVTTSGVKRMYLTGGVVDDYDSLPGIAGNVRTRALLSAENAELTRILK
jgi:hypothetical protein